ncbi:MAG: hypothetical protein Q4P32_07055 [Micrococcales bacterium]|nr:hypothetical protein [Micrococcales bacterium]
MGLKLVLRSYGGDNAKGRPSFYSKDLVVASFLRAAGAVRRNDAEVFFLNDGPIPPARLGAMERHGTVLAIPGGPVGMRRSYVYGLDLPTLLGWSARDIVAFIEDDYLLTADAFVALLDAEVAMPEVSYFALSGSRPDDLSDPAQRRLHQVPRGWAPTLADRQVGDRTWTHILSVASTFAARVGPLVADRDIFDQCMRPFRNRYLDHETCLLYQGIVPYHGSELVTGLPGDFAPGVRGLARTLLLTPYRMLLNRRARRQSMPHLLYAPQPSLAAHLEDGVMSSGQDWAAIAHSVAVWADAEDLQLQLNLE